MTEQQERMETQLRSAVLKEIDSRKLSNEQLAQTLGLLPAGVEVLRQRSRWPLETAIQVADALGFEVTLDVNMKTSTR